MDIKTYGAIGDGLTHPLSDFYATLADAQVVYTFATSLTQEIDWAAGQKALNLHADVFVPDGTFLLGADMWRVKSDTTLRGNGPGSRVRKLGGAIENLSGNLQFSTDKNIHIRNLAVDLGGALGIAISLTGVNTGSVTDCWVYDSHGYGIYIGRSDVGALLGTESRQIVVSNNHVLGGTDVGIEVWGSTGVTVTGNTVTGTAGIAYYAWNGASDVTFTGNTAEARGGTSFVAFEVSPPSPTGGNNPTRRISFVGNVAYNCTKGFRIIGSSALPTTDVVIDGNQIYGRNSSDFGIQTYYSSRIKFTNNVIDNVAQAMRVSVPNDGSGTNFACINSQFDDNHINGGSTSEFFASVGNSMSRNWFTGQNDSAIHAFGIRECNLDGNHVINAGVSPGRIGIYLRKNGAVECEGNTCNGNIGYDDRATPSLRILVAFGDASTANEAIGNIMRRGSAPVSAFTDFSTGTNLRIDLSSAISFPAWSVGFNFRKTLAYVTDDVSCTFSDHTAATYPTTKIINGVSVTYGWESPDASGSNDLTTTADSRQAGCVFRSNTGLPAVFRVNLPVIGYYAIGLSLGNPLGAAAVNTAVVKDGGTTRLTVAGVATDGTNQQTVDAAGVLRPLFSATAAPWPSSNVNIECQFSGTILRLYLGANNGTATNSCLQHLRITRTR